MSTMIVHGGWDAKGVADFSPFGLKVKTYLRMAGIPYVARMGDPRKGPTKKIPFIDDGGTIVGDSSLIVAYLKGKYGDKLDARLTAEQHALGHTVQRTVEDSLYFAILVTRWNDDKVFPEIAEMLMPLMPPIIGSFLVNGPIRNNAKKRSLAQGIGHHRIEEVHGIGCADVDAVAALLGEKTYLFGDAPSSYDATTFGFVANAMAFPTESPIALRARGHANLVRYVDRIKATYWATPDTKKPSKAA